MARMGGPTDSEDSGAATIEDLRPHRRDED